MEITDIKKSKTGYIVVINEQKLAISEETLLKLQLYNGKDLTEEQLSEVKKYEEQFQLFSKALHFISFKERSENEVKQYLYQKTPNYPVVLEMIAKLKQLQYINDERYVIHMIDSYIDKGKGKNVIRQKLNEKGIDKILIEEKISQINETKLLEQMNHIVQKELPRLYQYPINKQKQVVIQKLMRSGFSNSSAYQVLSQYEFTSDHQALLQKEFDKLKRKYLNKQTKEVKQKMIQSLLMKGFDFHEISQLMKLDEN